MLIKITSDKVTLYNPSSLFDSAETPQGALYLIGKCYDSQYRRLCAESLLPRLQEDMHAVLGGCQGIYGAVYQDKIHRKLVFFTDALGMGKLYYHLSADMLLLSEHTEEIVRASDVRFHTDYSAWAQFLMFSCILGGRTYFQEIKAVTPASCFLLDMRSFQLEEKRCSLFTGIRENPAMTLDTAVETSVRLLKSALSKILENNARERILLPLSGGSDSRCIAACLKALKVKNVETYTSYLDDGNGADEEYAKSVAEYLQFPHRQLSLEENYFEKEITGYLRDTNYETSMHLPFWSFSKKIHYSDSLLLDGYAGNRLLRVARHAAIAYGEDGSLPPDFLDTFFKNNANAFVKSAMDSRSFAYLSYLARQGMAEELQKWNNNITLYYMFNINARNMAYNAYHLDHFTDVFLPFTDFAFMEFALSIPYSIRKDEGFYKAVIHHLAAGLGDLPSTDDLFAGKLAKPIYFHSQNYPSLLPELGDYWEAIGGVYDANIIKKNLEQRDETQWHLARTVLPFWFYKKWKDRYRDRLTEDSLESSFKETAGPLQEEEGPILLLPQDERRRVIERWLAFVKRESQAPAGRGKAGSLLYSRPPKTKVLFTMDVEGFNEGPLFVHGIRDFTDAHRAVEQLMFGGRLPNGQSVLETLAADKNIPLTFFVEVYAAILAPEELEQLLSVCSSEGNEAGLHCHAFGLPQRFLQERNLKFDDYQNEQGFSSILRAGVDTFRRITGAPPLSYRSGSFQVYPGHFEALKKNGFRVDSSLFYAPDQYRLAYRLPDRKKPFFKTKSGPIDDTCRLTYDGIRNECRKIKGLLEIPCTTFYDIPAERTTRLDLNLVPFEKKVECIARNILAGSEAVTLLMHSWSFSGYSIQAGPYGRLARLCHHGALKQMMDELRYLAEFIRSTGMADLVTMRQAYQEHPAAWKDKHTNPVDVCGETVPLPVSQMPPVYGKMRGLCEEGFINLQKGELFSSDRTQVLCSKAPCGMNILLPEKKQPHAGDFTEIRYCIPVKKGIPYQVSMLLDCPYFREKFQGRNTIRYSVKINGEEVFSNYITSPERNEYIEHLLTPAAPAVEILIRLECLQDETPWGWGSCSKTNIKGIHLLALR